MSTESKRPARQGACFEDCCRGVHTTSFTLWRGRILPMATTNPTVAEPTPSTAFEPIPFYERLIALRTSDPEAFKRQTV